MEKKYEVKYIDVLYIDGKVIPVSLEYKKDKKYNNKKTLTYNLQT